MRWPSREKAGEYSRSCAAVSRRGVPAGRSIDVEVAEAWNTRRFPSGDSTGQRTMRARTVSANAARGPQRVGDALLDRGA